jgi:hypothetical protein
MLRLRARRLYRGATLDSLGRPPATWISGGSFRCDLRDEGVTETDFGGGPATLRRFMLVARWESVEASGLREGDRLSVSDGRTLRVLAIRDMGNRQRRAEIDCTEVVP